MVKQNQNGRCDQRLPFLYVNHEWEARLLSCGHNWLLDNFNPTHLIQKHSCVLIIHFVVLKALALLAEAYRSYGLKNI